MYVVQINMLQQFENAKNAYSSKNQINKKQNFTTSKVLSKNAIKYLLCLSCQKSIILV